MKVGKKRPGSLSARDTLAVSAELHPDPEVQLLGRPHRNASSELALHQAPYQPVADPLRVFKFFNGLGGADKEAKVAAMKKILGGYDLSSKQVVDAKTVVYYGQLPPREVALAQVLGMLVAPIRGFMHILNEKSKQA